MFCEFIVILHIFVVFFFFFFFKQKTAYDMRISDWSSDVCSSDLGKYACGVLEKVVPRCDNYRKEAYGRGDNYDEGDRGDGPGCGNGRDDAGGAARAAGSDKRRHRSGSCVGIRPD